MVVGRHVPGRRVRVGLVVEGGGDVGRRRRVDPLVHRRGQHEGLEGGAGLPPRLRGQVELVAAQPGSDRRHRADRAVCGVDRDDRRSGVVVVVERVGDRLPRRALQAWVDRGVHAQPAGAHGVRAVLRDQLLADEAEEVRLADLRVEPPRVQVQLPLRNRIGELLSRDVVADE